MQALLWVDDARNPLEDDWLNFSPIGQNCLVIWAQSYQEAIDFLEKEWPDAICLDHDLGEEKSGYDIAKYIVNRCIDDGRKLPLFASQSANPVGRENDDCIIFEVNCAELKLIKRCKYIHGPEYACRITILPENIKLTNL